MQNEEIIHRINQLLVDEIEIEEEKISPQLILRRILKLTGLDFV